MEVRIFGIRHHGPGSARTLQQALKDMEPDCVLIEGPEDANKLLPFVGEKGLKPPVAALVYNPKDFQWAAYLPFARFSPEWQAIRYALKRSVEVQLIDWPMGLAWEMEALREGGGLFGESPAKKETWRHDPLAWLAEVAGYSDSERWWDVHFERMENPDTIFDLITEMMRELRQETGPGDISNLWREAYMRKAIRKAVKAGNDRIAVVCGAWHAPALADWKQVPASADNKVFRGIRKKKTDAAWIPWTYERLAAQSGYGAGVVSPAWYRLLYDKRSEVTIRFLTRAARLLRQESLEASSAQVIDAVSLAEMLASIRGLPLPGIDELREAALSSFCNGVPERLALIDRRLVVGDRVGRVPGHLPMVPIQKDLEKQVRTCRLRREYEGGEVVTKKLDLRVESNKAASIFLHRLMLLDIPWGTRLEARDGALGSFQERWRLKWKAGFYLKLIEQSVFGKTIREAATACMRQKATRSEKLKELSEWTSLCLLGELPDVLDHLLARLHEVAADSQDIPALLEALPVLMRVFRYGDVRNTPPQAVGHLIGEWIPRLCSGLLASVRSIDTDEARIRYSQILQADRAISLYEDPAIEAMWTEAVIRLAELEIVAPIIRGGAARMAFDKGHANAGTTSRRMSYALSNVADVEVAASWLEGFLAGSALLLIHEEHLWKVLDDWISDLSYDHFKAVLPLLRRSFSAFPEAERKAIWKMVEGGRSRITGPTPDWVPKRETNVLPLLQTIFSNRGTGEN